MHVLLCLLLSLAMLGQAPPAEKPCPGPGPCPVPEPVRPVKVTRAELKAQEKAVREGLDKLAHRRPGDALEAIREAEPELVDQVVADHADEETV